MEKNGYWDHHLVYILPLIFGIRRALSGSEYHQARYVIYVLALLGI